MKTNILKSVLGAVIGAVATLLSVTGIPTTLSSFLLIAIVALFTGVAYAITHYVFPTTSDKLVANLRDVAIAVITGVLAAITAYVTAHFDAQEINWHELIGTATSTAVGILLTQLKSAAKIIAAEGIVYETGKQIDSAQK